MNNRKMSEWRFHFILTALAFIVPVGQASATCPDGRPEPCLSLPTPILTPPLSLTPSLGGITPTPVVRAVPLAINAQTPVAALAQATRQPATIRGRRLELSSAEAMELGYLVRQLTEIDTALLQYRKEVGAEYFYNMIELLIAALEKRAPDISSPRKPHS